jgi:hypothetical protein
MITIIISMCNNRMHKVTNRREASPRRRNASICGRLAFGTWINDGHTRTRAAPHRLAGPGRSGNRGRDAVVGNDDATEVIAAACGAAHAMRDGGDALESNPERQRKPPIISSIRERPQPRLRIRLSVFHGSGVLPLAGETVQMAALQERLLRGCGVVFPTLPCLQHGRLQGTPI